MDATSQPDLDLVRRVESPLLYPFLEQSLEPHAQRHGSTHSLYRIALPVIVLAIKNAEQCHNAVADELIEQTAVLEDGSCANFTVLAQEPGDEGRICFQYLA